jgi:hypothetical protein
MVAEKPITTTGAKKSSVFLKYSYSDAYLELAGGSLDPLPREDGPTRGQQVADHRVRGSLRYIAHEDRHRRTWRHVLDNNRIAF